MEILDREQLIERLSKIDFIVVGLETEVTHGLTITRISIASPESIRKKGE